ncbi:MAG: hypothetical protein AAES65_08745 [Candidatus Thiodiazotropha sp. (ex. Lucinoma kazani)]
MNIKDYLISSIIVTLFFFGPNTAYARNCIKGKPCGKGCIALDKQCRIDTNGVLSKKSVSNKIGHATPSHNRSTLRKSKLRLPKVYTVATTSVNATDAPYSNAITGHYREGQSVFVYETFKTWVRINNMKPEEWIEHRHLKQK